MRRLIVAILPFLTLAVPGSALAANLGPVLQQAQDVEQPGQDVGQPGQDVEQPGQDVEQPPQDVEQPAVVIEEDEGVPEEIAWTFRFLVPMLWLLTALVVVGTLVAYRRRLKKRFRVTG